MLQLEVRDDGTGGADPTGGSGLVGLTDRVAAIGGTIAIARPPGEGTTIAVELPIEHDRTSEPPRPVVSAAIRGAARSTDVPD